MALLSFLDKFNNFSIVATNIAFIYITLERKYGKILNEKQLRLATAAINMQYYLANDIYSLKYIEQFDSGPNGETEVEKITSLAISLQILIFMEQFEDVDIKNTFETVEGQKARITKAIEKVRANPASNSDQKRTYINDIDALMTSPRLESLRKEIGI